VGQRSLKVLEISAIRKLECGFLFAFYSNYGCICIAVCKIFSVKEWQDLENQVRGRSRSLKMAPFDTPYATFYWSAIANIALSCTIFEFLTLNNIVTLKSGLKVSYSPSHSPSHKRSSRGSVPQRRSTCIVKMYAKCTSFL